MLWKCTEEGGGEIVAVGSNRFRGRVTRWDEMIGHEESCTASGCKSVRLCDRKLGKDRKRVEKSHENYCLTSCSFTVSFSAKM